MSEQIERDIEATLEARARTRMRVHAVRPICHPPSPYRLLLSPGDRIPDVSARGRRRVLRRPRGRAPPVMAPVSTDDGNMRIDAIDDVTWSTTSAVLTGNTYGLPDRVDELSATCGRFEIPLIEDARPCARDGRRRAPDRELRRCCHLQLVEALPRAGWRPRVRTGKVDRKDVVRLRDQLMLPRPIGMRAVDVLRAALRACAGAPPSHGGAGSRVPPATPPDDSPMASAVARSSTGARAFER